MEIVVNRGFRGEVTEKILDAYIGIGYRVNSIRATQFRQWATIMHDDDQMTLLSKIQRQLKYLNL